MQDAPCFIIFFPTNTPPLFKVPTKYQIIQNDKNIRCCWKGITALRRTNVRCGVYAQPGLLLGAHLLLTRPFFKQRIQLQIPRIMPFLISFISMFLLVFLFYSMLFVSLISGLCKFLFKAVRLCAIFWVVNFLRFVSFFVVVRMLSFSAIWKFIFSVKLAPSFRPHRDVSGKKLTPARMPARNVGLLHVQEESFSSTTNTPILTRPVPIAERSKALPLTVLCLSSLHGFDV